jgi:20S proteasome alpha/beta subunit
MTIALGIRAVDGVVLCADSQYTSNFKSDGPKLFQWIGPNAVVVFAFSGDVGNSTAMIHEANEDLNKLKKSPTSERIKQTLARRIKSFQENFIDTRPFEEREEAQIDLIIAISVSGEKTKLFYTNKSVLVPFYACWAVGSGGCYIGQYVMRRAFRNSMTTDDAVVMAMQALAGAKQHDKYCGGPSCFATISDAGYYSHIVPFDVDKIERDILDYDVWSSNLLLDMADFSMDQKEFTRRVLSFTSKIQGKREMWRKSGSDSSRLRKKSEIL